MDEKTSGDIGCACSPASSAGWPEPDRGRMRFLIGAGIAQVGYGGYVVARRRPKWFPIWLAALVIWFTLCKYLICTRCERYGEACDFYYLGKWAARLFPPQPDKTLDTAGIIAEGGSAAVLQFLPVAAALRKPGLLVRYLVVLAVGQGAQLSICCRRCVAHSTDTWKRDTCPSYKLASRLYGGF